GTGARVQIPSPPPVIHRDAFRIGVDFLSLSTLFGSREVLLWIFPSAGHPHPPHRTGVTPAPWRRPPAAPGGLCVPAPETPRPPRISPGGEPALGTAPPRSCDSSAKRQRRSSP